MLFFDVSYSAWLLKKIYLDLYETKHFNLVCSRNEKKLAILTH